MIIQRTTIDGHDVEIFERMVRGGVDGIIARCHTCNRCKGFYQEQYPKWRLAMADARKFAASHFDQPLDSQTSID